MTILDLISMPESKTLEFKERMPEPLAIAKTACAFANGGGGTILIGVADKEKTITGIDAQEIHILEEKGYLVWKGKSKKDPSGYYELTGSTMIQL
jgi:ATP-dependent DNA helicase RecG